MELGIARPVRLGVIKPLAAITALIAVSLLAAACFSTSNDLDGYWDGDYYYLVLADTPEGYCEVNLWNNDRRVGESASNRGPAGERTFEFFFLFDEPEFNGYEIECLVNR